MRLSDPQRANIARISVVTSLLASLLISGIALADHSHKGTDADPFEEPIAPQGTFPNETLPVLVGEKYYGVNGSTVIWFWSGDYDSEPRDRDVGEDNEYPSDNLNQTEQTMVMRTLAGQDDERLIQYPSPVNTWNKYNWGAFRDNVTISNDTSYYPPDAELVDDEWISDAHATIFWINGSRQVYEKSGRTSLWLPPSSDIRALVDYRVDLPANDTELYPDGSLTYYSLTSTEITDTCVLGYQYEIRDCDSDQVIGEGDGEHFSNITYDMGVSRPWYMAFRAEINTTVRVDSHNYVNKGGHSEWINNTYYYSDQTVLTEGIDFDAPPEFEADVHRAEYPNGTVDYSVEFFGTGRDFSQASWQTIGVNGSRIMSKWRFFTMEKDGWETMNVATENNTTSIHSTATPVSVRSYPTGEVQSEGGDEGFNLVQNVTYRPEVESPGVAEGISANISTSNGSYRPSKRVRFRHGAGTIVTRSYDPSEVKIDDLNFTTVGGGSIDIRNGYNHEIETSNLQLTRSNESGSHFSVEIHLTDDSGNPINLQSPERGYIEIENKIVETGPNGRATVQFPIGKIGEVSAEYRPTPWYTLGTSDTAYVPASDSFYRSTSRQPSGFLLYVFDVLFLPVFLLVCIYVAWNRTALLNRL